jgi:hypothetical protein
MDIGRRFELKKTDTSLVSIVACLLVAGCIGAEPSSMSTGEAWRFDDEQEDGESEESGIRTFGVDDVATIDRHNAATSGRGTGATWLKISLHIYDGPSNVLETEEGEFMRGAYLQVAFPQSEFPEPRRFYLPTRREYFQLSRTGYSQTWLDSWPGVHATFLGSEELWLQIPVSEDIVDSAQDESTFAHPMGRDVLSALGRMEGHIGHDQLEVRADFDVQTDIASAWPPDYPGRGARTECVLGIRNYVEVNKCRPRL